MPVQVPLVIGDIPYPQYSTTDREIIKDALAITKGFIYTPDSEGRLIVPITTSSVADLTRGAIQAQVDATAPTAEDTDEVQVLKARSRIILKAPAGLVKNEEVELKAVTSTTTQDKVQKAIAPRNKGYLGRIYQILTQGTDGVVKQKTADNDLIIIDLEG